MFTKLKKKIAEEAAITPRPGGAARIPRSVSKESITSVGADSGDDFASDGSSSRDDLPSQISRRNDQIRRLEAKLSDYAEQVRNLQKTKEKLELALEKHQDSTVRKFQEQNEAHQVHRAKMDEEYALALEKKDQEWLAKIASLEEEKQQLSNQIDTMKKNSLSFFQKGEDLDELEVIQQQEISKIQLMLLNKEELLTQVDQELELLRTELVVSRAECQDVKELSARLKQDLEKVQEENDKLSQQRTELTTAQESAEKKITELDQRQQELQDFIQRSLELQKVSTLNRKLQEAQDLLQQKEAEFKCFKEESVVKLNDTEQTLQTVRERLQNLEEKLKEQEKQINSCGQLETEVVSLKEKNTNLEVALRKHKAHQENIKEELSSKETRSVEMAKALEETHKQKKDLQQQVADLNAKIEKNTLEISLKNEELIRKNEETANLKRDFDALVLQMQLLHSDLEIYKTRVAQNEQSSARHSVRDHLQKQNTVLLASESQVSSLQEAVSALLDPLNGTRNQESNGEVGVSDISQLQRENQELEQQIAEKNKTIKQLQQRMVELKKTLQKELKLKPEPELNDVREKPTPDPLATSVTVTSSSDLTDSQEINFEYLKHVVLKFMSAREAEAFHLIKAVSVLLNFSVEEENLLKETLEYKMSWFGSKPLPKGTVRPSISKPRTTWS